MRKLDRRQRLGVVLSSFCAITPSVVFAVKGGHVDRALGTGIFCGLAVGTAVLFAKRKRGLCATD